MRKRAILISLGIVAFIIVLPLLIIWSPWLNEEIAAEKAITHFEKSWENPADGCYLNCESCGTLAIEKDLFGYVVTLRYQCGWEGDVITMKTSDIFINVFGRTDFNIHEELQRPDL